jgi:hypothetical protein
LGDALSRPEFGGKAVLAGPGLEGAFEGGQILGLEASKTGLTDLPLKFYKWYSSLNNHTSNCVVK